jgi:dynein heavy chain
LHVVLCFSPVGDKFRIRARQFPALVNCTQLDWFHGWPAEALLSVATRFLADVPDVNEELRVSMAQYMAQAHQVGVFDFQRDHVSSACRPYLAA